MSEEVKTQELSTQSKSNQVTMGFGQRGAEIRTLDDAFRIAKAVHLSGFSPLKTVEANFIAIQLGAEIGLPPMAAVQSIYAVNNRPAMMVANALAIVEGSGVLADIEEKIDGQGEARKAICKITRKGRQPYVVEYSMADAKKAELLNKDNWKKFPDRMLKARALGYALRDRFQDKLMGIGFVEELQDITPEVQVVGETKNTPKPTTLSALEATLEKQSETSRPEPTKVGEVVKDEPVKSATTPIKQAPVDDGLKRWLETRDQLKASINRAKNEAAVNEVFKSDRALDLKDNQPSLFDEVQDFAMNRIYELTKG